MAFNSLDAQREAGIDYIKSQRSHGWAALPTAYDDGGYSGGTTERPGLQRLLADIRAGRIDIVVVYKVDRLSRSLNDFARLMQTFDEHNVSFVSVTQQFNTTTSMGRLTLNMLLSFAQFEREVAGERIRDKIGATMRKGLFIVGQPPVGYRRPGTGDPDPDNRVIRVVPEEAGLVRRIFAEYLEHGSLVRIAQGLNAEGQTTRRWTSSKKRDHGGHPWTTAIVNRILTNPTYIGKIAHTRGSHLPKGKDRGPTEVWPGLHEPIIDEQTWQRVRERMDDEKARKRMHWPGTHLVKGKIFTSEGHRLTPGSSAPRRPGGRVDRIAYYVSMKAMRHGYASCPIRCINAGRIDDLVRAMVLDRLEVAHGLSLDAFESETRDRWVREVVERVTVGVDRIDVVIGVDRIRTCAEAHGLRFTPERGDGPRLTRPRRCIYLPEIEIEQGVDAEGAPVPIRETLWLAISLAGTRGTRAVVSPDGRDLTPRLDQHSRPEPMPHIVRALGQAFALHEELMRTGDDVNDVARRNGVQPGRAHHLLHLTRLSPAIIRAALEGTLGTEISLNDLRAAASHLDWDVQARHVRLTTGN